MALKRLLPEEMIQLSAEWIEPKSKAHKAILASPDLAPSMPRLVTAHQTLARLSQPAVDDPRLAEISKEEANVDSRHDDIIRGAYDLLTATALLLGDDGAALVALRDLLFPAGPSATKMSYRAESGLASQLKDRLSPAVRAQLASILVGPKNKKLTLEQFIDELIAHGARLGALEDEKGRLQRAPTEPAMSAGAVLLAARNQWVRIVNALIANGEIAELDGDSDTLIFGPLRAAERAAERRGARASGKAKAGDDSTEAKPETDAEPAKG